MNKRFHIEKALSFSEEEDLPFPFFEEDDRISTPRSPHFTGEDIILNKENYQRPKKIIISKNLHQRIEKSNVVFYTYFYDVFSLAR